MRGLCILFVFLILPVSGLLSQNSLDLIPYPSGVNIGNGEFRIKKDFNLSTVNGTERLFKASTRFLRRLGGRTGIFLPQNIIGADDDSDTASLIIRVTREGMVELDENESYSLKVGSNQILLQSETDIGALRGLETLLQLLSSNSDGYYFPVVEIEDEPRFPWRGLLIDVGRHWIPENVIKRNIDGMAAVKLNVLHLHLTEDQGFRIESKTFPKLHQLGSNGGYFTQEQIREIIKYAADRGIRVVPEFDMPGHATSWFVGYPELASAPGPYQVETDYGVQDPTMDPTKEGTYEFLDKFFKEMAALFPDRFMHIGGDENNGKQWDNNKQIQAYMKQKGLTDNHELQGYFNERILGILDKYGKRMMGWDEIFKPGVPEDILIQSWRGKEALYESARKGYQTILSNGYYIDLMQPASFHYLNDPIPPGTDLTEDQKRNILGGEAAMWTEIATQETIDSRIWPRTAAIAERLWSPGGLRDVENMYHRLDVISVQLEELGLQHETYYEMMLRRLAGNLEITPLKILVDILEPVEGYERHEQVQFTTFSPFTRVADAARPESRSGRYFSSLVDNHIKSNNLDYVSEIKEWMLMWIENHSKFLEMAERSPVLRDAESLSLDLSNISKIGLQALSSTVNHSESWKLESYKMLDAALQSRMECEISIVTAIRKLVDAAE